MTIIWIVSAIVACSVVFIVGWRAVRTYFTFRGTRLVTCPETGDTAAVEVDATYAALTTSTGERSLRLKDCNRWPEREECGQECLAQIEAAPQDCVVRRILTKWYEGKKCVVCGKTFRVIDWLDHRPVLMSPEGVTMEWSEIVPEKVPELLASHLPVCWNCYIVETFRRRFPELVVDRPWRPGESQRSG